MHKDTLKWLAVGAVALFGVWVGFTALTALL